MACGIGSALNNLTGIAGVRLFPGGPYTDRGNMDLAKNASQPLQAAGQQLLQQGTAALPNIFGQIASTAGVANPLTGAPPMLDTTNPYGFSPTQLAEYNTQAATINQNRKNALDSFKSSQAARGLSSSSAKSTEQYINHLADTELNTTFSNAAQAAQQARMQGLVQLLSGAQSDVSQGGNLIQGNVGTLQNAAQAATQASQQGIADLVSALTLGLTAGGVIPTTAGTAGAAGKRGAVPIPGAINNAAGAAPMGSTGMSAMANPQALAAILASVFQNSPALVGSGTPAQNPQSQYDVNTQGPLTLGRGPVTLGNPFPTF